MRKITIKEIAEYAGVSPMTVSNVINRKKNVGVKTKDKILALFDAEGYVPNELAQQMGRRKKKASAHYFSRNICILRKDPKNYFYNEIFEPLENNILHAGYHIAYNYRISALHRDVLLRNKIFDKHQIDGIILSDEVDDFIVGKIKDSGLPVVSISNQFFDIFNSIAFDLSKAARLAVNHLINLGHRKIGYFGRVVNNTDLRFIGYRMAMEGAGLPIKPEWIVEDNDTDTIKCGENGSARILAQTPELTAILSYNDITAIGLMKGLVKSGYRVPDDISVIGIDGSYIGDFASPALTSIGVDIDNFGKTAVDLLIKLIKTQSKTISTVLVSPVLYEKESCRAI